ncbi:uncharacterized protein BX663DRAFT_548851 [Cokeromyces recurvatus]|uniref:uncharacterized protein n=1 Tax=Cokeromyces recurvatus TaxID=90255 RepID=UPI00221F6E70|nr:uncharacterized protein BX663DRAFT_548851 [Cokeromyces recurvatus]KAI7906693.1 hypothetical protein BX663DRAFT_548851 [Cokeromyces recurvatus]
MPQNFNNLPTTYHKWIPHPSTNAFKQPRVLDWRPLQGQVDDSFQIELDIHDIDPSLLRIAFNTCFTTCQYSLNTVTQTMILHTTVPNTDYVSCTNLSRVPIYLLVVQDQNKILDCWFIGYFSYFLTNEFNQFNNTTTIADTSKQQEHIVPSQQTNHSTDTVHLTHPTSPSSLTTSMYAPTNVSSYYPTTTPGYLNMAAHVPYIGLPPTQPSSRPREYFEEQSMLNYSPNTFQSTYQHDNQMDTTSAAAAAAAASLLSAQVPPTAPAPPAPAPPPSSSSQHEGYMVPIVDTLSQFSQPLPILPSSPSVSSTTPHPIQIKPAQPHPHPPSLAITSTGTPAAYPPPIIHSNPFANLLNRPTLHIENDLETMMENWTRDEENNQRRLVRFFRRQEGNEIFCHCERFEMPSITLERPRPDLRHQILVSCIRWEDDYYITSVDCIFLLQHLLGVSFTVEEKNRIRRNLEGFQPRTVAKMKPESAEFFKLIMAFGDPKPRNIEKDLKVFRWKDLDKALKKIIGKYTASYSSTASVLESVDR